MSQHTTSSTVERKAELLIIARRSRIKWIRSAANTEVTEHSRKIKPVSHMENEKTLATKSADNKPSSYDAFQRAFDFLTDIIADGETVDLESLTQKIEICDYGDENFADARDDHTESAALSIIGDIAIENYSYDTFLDILSSRNAVGAVKSMQQFVSKFESKQRTRTTGQRTSSHCYIDEKTNYEESLKDAESIWLFLDYIVEEIQPSSIPVASIFIDQLRLTKRYCEKFLFFKLYPSTFHTSFEDYFQNEKLFERIQSLSFLRPEHLDIRIPIADSNQTINQDTQRGSIPISSPGPAEEKWWVVSTADAVLALNELQYATCPDDKMACIKRAALSIISILRGRNKTIDVTDTESLCSSNSQSESQSCYHQYSDPSSLTSADDVLPLLILCVKESNPVNLYSELKYLHSYLNPSLSQGELGYLLTQFASAVNFLENVDATALTISSAEFNKSIKKSREKRYEAKGSFGNMKIDLARSLSEENNEKLIFLGTESKPRMIKDEREKKQEIVKYIGDRVGQDWSHADTSAFQNGSCSNPQNGLRSDLGKGVLRNETKEKELTLFEIYMRKSLRR